MDFEELETLKESRGYKVAEDLGDYVNSFNHNPEDFINGFCMQHRTLQQSGFKVIMKLLEHMASPEYRVDGRNEDSKVVAQKLVAAFKEKHDFLPSQMLRFI